MASNNLRIIRKNLTELPSLELLASSTASAATSVANLKKDAKSLVWRSSSNPATITANGTLVFAKLIANFPGNAQLVGGVILPFCNLSPQAVIRVTAYVGQSISFNGALLNTSGSTIVADTGYVLACPYQNLGTWEWGSVPLGENSYTSPDYSTGANSYSYGGGSYARVWLPTHVPCTSIAIEIQDTRNIGDTPYIEASRLVFGSYWSPKYNTSYGITTGVNDQGTKIRTDSGDLLTSRGTLYRSMSFPLDWMTPTDLIEFNKILKSKGSNTPLFISLFPDNLDDWGKEQVHQIYGKLSDLSQITHHTLGMYGANINIEEV